jgi:hypothetical protein
MCDYLSDEKTGLQLSCCWASPAQSSSGPSLVGLMHVILLSCIEALDNRDGQSVLHPGIGLSVYFEALSDVTIGCQSILMSGTHLGLMARWLVLADSCSCRC